MNNYFHLKDIKIKKIGKMESLQNVKNLNIERIKQTISIVIPCHHLHFIYLKNLLEHYEKQSLLPMEIIIVICESNKLKINQIKNLKEKTYKFNLEIIDIPEKSPAGNNRYLGSQRAKGNIIIFQDADDLPHKQRNEIIEHFFSQFPDIVHICHSYTFTFSNEKYDLNDIKYKILQYNIFCSHGSMGLLKITNGNIGIRKEILNKINWDTKSFRGQDVAMNKEIYNKFKKSLFIRAVLYTYRKNLSTRNKC